MNLKDYIQGKRHGKEANALERKALNDAFLQDALDGFDAVKGDHLPVIEELEKRIVAEKSTKKITPVWRWVAAAVALLLIGTSLLEIFNYNNKNLPQVATVKPKTEIPAVRTKDSVIVADNMDIKSTSNKPKKSRQISTANKKSVVHSPVATKDTSDGIEVIGYSSKEKSDSDNAKSVVSIKSDELSYGNRLDTANDLLGFNPAANGELNEDALKGRVAGLGVHTELENTFWLKNDSTKTKPALSGKLASADVNNKTEQELQGKIAGIDIKAQKTVYKVNSNINKVVKGRVFDENGEPLIGATVMVKGTKNGAVTNYDGEFELPLLNVKKNSLLVASYIGYETQEIPIKENVGDIKLLADNKTLDEVVVTGYGAKKKSYTSSSVSAISATSSQKYVYYKKEFINDFKQHYDKNICQGHKISIKATFKLNEYGHPADVVHIETNCPEMEAELKRWLEKSPNWTKKNKTITIRFSIR